MCDTFACRVQRQEQEGALGAAYRINTVTVNVTNNISVSLFLSVCLSQ